MLESMVWRTGVRAECLAASRGEARDVSEQIVRVLSVFCPCSAFRRLQLGAIESSRKRRIHWVFLMRDVLP